ncbi:MAG TPA: dolichyl-phosphate beta-glucosyltransferase [Candidatus Dormibacteraeota bacterium]|nr:dolichyl-phosphate beta-glucosyltransferase [Candidatus Dormibacteraeota bacterium]
MDESIASTAGTQVDVVIPVYNEERVLEEKIHELHDFLSSVMYVPWQIVIADNASTDKTREVAQKLSRDLQHVSTLHIPHKGRGLALKTAWGQSLASVMTYMDVDLSTNLNSFLPLIAPILSGHSDIAIGSRLRRGARVSRRFKREFISRSYNLLVKFVMHSHFSDAQCGFKAISARAARLLLPRIENNTWFFDTELLLLAEHMGLRIFEVPVDWIEDLDSRVNIPKTVMEDVQGLWRMRLKLWFQRDSLRELEPVPVSESASR